MRDLTVRGRCFLAAGAAAIICGIQIGERDFVRIGLLAALIPLLAWLLLRRTERDVWVRRNVSALQVEAGETAQVEVEIGNAGRRTGTAAAGGGAPRRPRASATALRGRAAGAGADHAALPDPRPRTAGATRSDRCTSGSPTRSAWSTSTRRCRPRPSILVTPRTEPLPQIPLTGRWAGAGDNRTRDLLGGGSPDVTIREYRLGDDLRRIHWPSSARADELMVRREEQQWQSRCTLLIDNRRISHRGYGAGLLDGDAPSASTASIMRNLVALDFEVRLVSATGQSSAHGWHQGARGGQRCPSSSSASR